MLSPIAMESADDQPEELVPGVEPWAALGSESDLELLVQEEILEKEIVMVMEGSRKDAEQEPEEGEHCIRMASLASASGPVLSFCPPTGSGSAIDVSDLDISAWVTTTG